MNKIQRLFAGKAVLKQLEEIRLKYLQTGVRYQIMNGQLISPAENETSYIDNAYRLNDIVYSCVNLIVDKCKIAPWGIYKVVDESSLKQYQSIISRKDITGKDFKKAADLRKKALEEITSYGLQEAKLKELMTYPNSEQTWQEFLAKGFLYKLITGNKYIWGEMLKGGANAGIPGALHVLPSQYTRLQINGGVFPATVSGYEMMAINQKFTKEEVLHEKYPNLDWSINGSQLYGMSPLKAAIAGVVARNNSAAQATAAQYKNRGLEEIIYLDDPIARDANDGKAIMDNLKLKLKHELTGEENYGKKTTAPYKVGALQLGLSAKDMEIIASEKWDMVRIYNIFGVPPALSSPENMTLDNLKVGEKSLTIRCALPALTSFRDMFNWKLKTDWGFKGKNIFVDFDMTVYSELAENVKDVVDWTSKLIAVKPNDQLEMAGMEASEDPMMDEYWVMMGGNRVPLSEFQLSDVDNALNDEQGDTEDGDGKVPKNGKGASWVPAGNHQNGTHKATLL